jgi:hypothetical protein
MLVALVVSVVAEAANPETLLTDMELYRPVPVTIPLQP